MAFLKCCWGVFSRWWPLFLALALTAAFLVWAYFLAAETTVQEGVRATRWDHFLHGRPNELGDTLAGFVGSLTLIWVVASVLQQSMELSAQRREFKKMVEAQDAQVHALYAQAAIFEDERKFRDESKAAAEIGQLLSRLSYEIDDEAIRANLILGAECKDRRSIFFPRDLDENDFDYLFRNRDAVGNFFDTVDDLFFDRPALSYSDIGFYTAIESTTSSILRVASRLSEGEKVRLERLDLSSMLEQLTLLLAQKNWKSQWDI